MVSNLFNRKKRPIFVETKVLVMETVEDDFLPQNTGDILFPGEVQEVLESWSTSFINADKIIGITKSPDSRERSIIWVEFGNVIVQERFDDALEWLKLKKTTSRENLLDTEIKIGGAIEGEPLSGESWSPTRFDLSECYMVNTSGDEGRAILWFKEDKVMIGESMRDMRKVLNIN